ncbi:MAG: hypothetical protein IKU79_05910 [Bacteroidaceae bacterium]|nr:hypothetical protein [Bacteroidaceae bacterium]
MAIISTDVETRTKTLMSRQILCSTERKYHLTNGFMLSGRLLIAQIDYPQYNRARKLVLDRLLLGLCFIVSVCV